MTKTVIISGEFDIVDTGVPTGASADQQLFLHHDPQLGGQSFNASDVDLYPLTYVDDDGELTKLDTPADVGVFADNHFKADADPFALKGNHFVRKIRDAIIVLPLKLTLLTAKDAELPFWDEIRVEWADGSQFVVNSAASYPATVRANGQVVQLNQPVDWFLKVLYGAYGFANNELFNFVLGGPENANMVKFQTAFKLDKRTPDTLTVG